MKPLKGIKVVSLALNLPGPLVAGELVEWGAQVTKIEPLSGDPVQSHFPKLYTRLHQGQKILKMNLKEDSPRKKLNTLLSKADLLITSSRISALKSLGLSRQSLQSRFPGLSHVAIAGYGPSHEHRPGHDLTYQASKGFVQPPQLPATLWADLAGAQKALTACLACFIQKQKTRRGLHLSISLADALDFFALPVQYGLTSGGGILGGGSERYGLYQTKQGWIAVAALEDHFWERLLAGLGIPLHAHEGGIKAKFLEKTAFEWENWAVLNDVPIIAVRTFEKTRKRSKK